MFSNKLLTYVQNDGESSPLFSEKVGFYFDLSSLIEKFFWQVEVVIFLNVDINKF